MAQHVFVMTVIMVTALANATWAETVTNNDEQSLRLELTLADGSRIIGIPGIEAVTVETSYARMNIPLKQIQTLKIGEDRETVSLDLQNGDKLKGVINLAPIKLTTVFGQVSIGTAHIKQIDVVLGGGAGQKGLALWNRLGTESDIKNSRVGPGGTLTAGRFVEGRFGQGIELNMQEQYGVTFPGALVSPAAGCIEFWAKLVNFPTNIRQPGGAWPGLIAACDDTGTTAAFLMHYCANDGGSGGGLCFQGPGNGGTGRYGSWSYASSLGSNTTDEWHHYALVWAVEGIPGVDNGRRKAAIFVDGKLNTGFWNGEGSSLTLPKTARVGLLAHHGTESGRVVYDNLKIWNYAKTDFSDRTQE
ncbi:MAG: hypothetical protein ACOYOU_05150 [Kiritimatiellia bacterium]